MTKNTINYFLGANSCTGFFSAFCDSYDPFGGWKAYIIKGGPGTGKSSFMRYFAKKAQEKGYDIITCPCSSDPDSLDAVILPKRKIILMDGTAPHIVEPNFPGACEEILNFGSFWKRDRFKGAEKDILEATLTNKALHATASRYLFACGSLMNDNYKTALSCTDKKKVEKFSETLCKNNIPSKHGKGKEWVRFITGVTPKGIVSYTDTIKNTCRNIIVVSDKHGSASNIIMNKIREYSLANGYEIITLKNTFLPETLIDHIVIPALSLGFVTENAYIKFDTDSRRIHARRFVNNSLLHNSRERLKFNKKASAVLLNGACETIKKAKSSHDILESYYIDAMDFKALNSYAEQFAKEIL